MSEKPLLLSSAKTGVLVVKKPYRGFRVVAIAIGIAVVLVGAADASSRLAHAVFGPNASLFSFAPAIAITDPSLFSHFLAASTPLTPVRLKITSIGVDANVEQVGQNAAGAMGAPTQFGDVAWYALGPKPGAPGNAVIAGHVNNALTTAGVFEHLSQLKPGDSVSVSDASGQTLNYIVTQVQAYPADQAPTSTIFATGGPSQLVLITCDGDWVSSEHQFNERLVVYASLAS